MVVNLWIDIFISKRAIYVDEFLEIWAFVMLWYDYLNCISQLATVKYYHNLIWFDGMCDWYGQPLNPPLPVKSRTQKETQREKNGEAVSEQPTIGNVGLLDILWVWLRVRVRVQIEIKNAKKKKIIDLNNELCWFNQR